MVQSSRYRANDPAAPLSTTSLPLNRYADDTQNTSNTSWDSHYQRRGRNREQFDYVNSSSEKGLSPNQPQRLNHQHQHQHQHQEEQEQEQQYPRRPSHRRTRSADSRPQYSSSRNTTTTSYREGLSSSQINSHRAHSDEELGGTGAGRGSDSFGFFQLPRYEAVIHDDSIYASSDRQQHRGNVITEQLQLQLQLEGSPPVGATGSRSPTRSLTQMIRPPYNISQRMEFAEQQQQQQQQQQQHQPHDRHSLYDQERQYYDYAKDNLITFGRCDVPTVSTGLSQEELLQRKRREETREKRKEKRRNKTSNKQRIFNFSSSLLKTSDQQSHHHHQQQEQQQQQQQQKQKQQQQYSPQRKQSLNYKNMATIISLDSNSCVEIVNNGDVDSPNLNSNSSRSKGIRGSMVSS